MLKKLTCIGLGVMIVVSLSGCGKENKINEYDKGSNVNIINNEMSLEPDSIKGENEVVKNSDKNQAENNIALQAEDKSLNAKNNEKSNFDERYDKAINFEDYDSLLNDVYKYLKENMAAEEFDKLKKDEIEWIKLKEKAISDYINYDGYWEDDDGEAVNTQFTRERCAYLISLSRTLKYSSIIKDDMFNMYLRDGVSQLEYNDNIYYIDEDKLYEISTNLENESRVITDKATCFKIIDNCIYMVDKYINLKDNKVTALDNLLYVDDEIMILKPEKDEYKIIRNKDMNEKIITFEDGDFLTKEGNRIYFQKCTYNTSYLYYLEVGNYELKCIHSDNRANLWRDYSFTQIHGYRNLTYYITAGVMQSEFMKIDNIYFINNEIYIDYYVDEFDLGAEVGCGAYDRRLVKFDLYGNNIEDQGIYKTDMPAVTIYGPNLEEKIALSQIEDEKLESYKVSSENNYFELKKGKNNDYTTIARFAMENDFVKELSKDTIEYVYGSIIKEFENFLMVKINGYEISGWRDIETASRCYLIRKKDLKCVNIDNVKNPLTVEIKNK